MRTDEVEEIDEHGDEIIRRLEGKESLLCFVPRLELLIKAFDEIVRDVVFETLDPDMFHPLKEPLYGRLVG